jgi:hypothetical protein
LFGAQPISGKDVVVAEDITEVNVGDPQPAVRTADAGGEVEEPADIEEPAKEAAVVGPVSAIPV